MKHDHDQLVMLVGCGLWAVALVVLLIVQPPAAQQWWIWTCAVAIAGGLLGALYMRRKA